MSLSSREVSQYYIVADALSSAPEIEKIVSLIRPSLRLVELQGAVDFLKEIAQTETDPRVLAQTMIGQGGAVKRLGIAFVDALNTRARMKGLG